jgi:8-oxo-dGTP pyrophosphatase MutT (NUDIX family)
LIKKKEIVFDNRWLKVEAKHTDLDPEPFYSLKVADYVAIVAWTPDGQLVCVRQYRPAIETTTLELPSGLVDGGFDAATTARRELEEETGYRAGDVQHLGTLFSDTGRLQNKLWCYLARDVRPVADWKPEAGIEPVLVEPADVRKALADGRFNHALHVAALHLASADRPIII